MSKDTHFAFIEGVLQFDIVAVEYFKSEDWPVTKMDSNVHLMIVFDTFSGNNFLDLAWCNSSTYTYEVSLQAYCTHCM